MSTDTDERVDVDDDYREELEADDDAYEAYKSISKTAVGSLVLALLGLDGPDVPRPAGPARRSGIVFGILAWRNLRRYPDELTGRTTATLGLVGSLALLVGGSVMHTYVYMTEVPDGLRAHFLCRSAAEGHESADRPARAADGPGWQADFREGLCSSRGGEYGADQEVHSRARHGNLLFRRAAQVDGHDRSDHCAMRPVCATVSANAGWGASCTSRIASSRWRVDCNGGFYELEADYVK